MNVFLNILDVLIVVAIPLGLYIAISRTIDNAKRKAEHK